MLWALKHYARTNITKELNYFGFFAAFSLSLFRNSLKIKQAPAATGAC
jgi:hypothetical protein